MVLVLAAMTTGAGCLIAGGLMKVPTLRTVGFGVVLAGFGLACLPLLAVAFLELRDRFRGPR